MCHIPLGLQDLTQIATQNQELFRSGVHLHPNATLLSTTSYRYQNHFLILTIAQPLPLQYQQYQQRLHRLDQALLDLKLPYLHLIRQPMLLYQLYYSLLLHRLALKYLVAKAIYQDQVAVKVIRTLHHVDPQADFLIIVRLFVEVVVVHPLLKSVIHLQSRTVVLESWLR